MYNYANLSDYEFELLCRDIMEKKLGRSLRCFAPGKDGGVDIMEAFDAYYHTRKLLNEKVLKDMLQTIDQCGYEECDYAEAAEIAEKIKDDVYDEIYAVVSLYPVTVRRKISYDQEDVDISLYDIKQYLEEWNMPFCGDDDDYDGRGSADSGEDILDVMFR